MSSTALGVRPRHRAKRRGSSRPVWTIVLVVVLVVAVAAVAHRAISGSGQESGLVIVLPRKAPTEPTDLVHGTLNLTDGCFSVPMGLLVWPVGTQWDPASSTVHITFTKTDWELGTDTPMLGTLMSDIPDAPSPLVPQSLLDQLHACSARTGIRSVAFVG